MKNDYGFDVNEVKSSIIFHMKEFLEKIGYRNVVLGISGGKDSTICAALAKEAVGADHVYGVTMPNGEQKDIQDSLEVIRLLGIRHININIEDAFGSIVDALDNNCLEVSSDTRINLPPRLRMSALYAVAQSVGGIVLNCDNLCEILAGYYTIFGDGAGSYGPLRDLTVPEVVKLGEYLGLPDRLIHKKPGDGLQPDGDEDRLGFTYSEMHDIIRNNNWDSENSTKILRKFMDNRFKSDMVRIPHPELGLPNYINNRNG